MDVIRKMRQAAAPVVNPDGSVNLDSIDYSAVSQYLKCPRQFYFRHILGRRQAPQIAFVEGTSHHAAMEADNVAKIKRGKSLKHGQLTDVFVDSMETLLPVAEREAEEARVPLDWSGDDTDSIVKRARILHHQYSREFSPSIHPEAAELPVSREAEVGGVRFRMFGQIDVVEANRVDDFKAVKRVKTERDAASSLQLAIYSWMTKKPEVSYISFAKTKVPRVVQVTVPCSEARQAWALEVVAGVVNAIRRGSFPMTDPSNYLCSSRWCGYWSECRGKYDETVPPLSCDEAGFGV